MYKTLKFLFGWVLRLIFPVKIYGAKNLGKKRLITAMNHLGAVDPVLLCIYLKQRPHFWGKKELFKGRFGSWFLRKMGVVKIDRDGRDLMAFKQALTILKEEKLFALFPEGTRNLDDPERMLKLKSGVALLAIRSESPIRLIYLHHRQRAFKRNYMMVGDEFTLEEFYGKKATGEDLDKAMGIIETKYVELQEKLTEKLVLKGIMVRT